MQRALPAAEMDGARAACWRCRRTTDLPGIRLTTTLAQPCHGDWVRGRVQVASRAPGKSATSWASWPATRAGDIVARLVKSDPRNAGVEGRMVASPDYLLCACGKRQCLRPEFTQNGGSSARHARRGLMTERERSHGTRAKPADYEPFVSRRISERGERR
jgi:hypothetical protein